MSAAPPPAHPGESRDPEFPRAVGVSRDVASPGEKSVLVAFNRRLTDDELRALHNCLLAFAAQDEPPIAIDFEDVLDGAQTRIAQQAAEDGVAMTLADARVYGAHALDALDAEQFRLGIMVIEDGEEWVLNADEAKRKRLAS